MAGLTDPRPLDWMRRSTIEGLVALVVGAGSGMGAASARTFAANGAVVIVADRDLDAAEDIAAGIVAAGGQAQALHLDMAESATITAAVASVIKAHGRLDILVNLAVLVGAELLEEADLALWDRAFHVNVRAALELALAARPYLRKSPAAAIVFVASLAGTHGYARSGSYGPSKGALITLAKQMALEWAVDNIRVNLVIPGTILSPGMERDLAPEAIETRKKQIPLGRLSWASEQADAAVFLASPAASFITGQALVVDGGFSQSLYPQPMGLSETMRERAARLSEASLSQG